jgi:polysaccharide biosynthesis/export protein
MRRLLRQSRLLSLCLAVLLSGCNRCPDIPCLGINWCCGRPDVMMDWESCVIDYNDCFEDCDLGAYRISQSGMATLEKTPELFDPFAPIDPDYRLTKGDILQVSVFGEEETLVDGAIVAPDGKLYYSVLDGVPAEGRTPEDVADDLASRLDFLFVNPQVTIVPSEVVYPAFRILGRVRMPGEYQLTGPITVREAIAQAGGLYSESNRDIGDHPDRINIPYTNLEASFMVRGDKRVDIDFRRLIFSADNDQNIYVKPGDYIYLSGEENREIFMLGYVVAPQRLPYNDQLTLMSALASVGGWPTPSPYSPDLHRFVVIRNALDCPCPQVCIVDIHKILRGEARDLKLCPGDIVYAAHKQWRSARELVHIAVDSFISTFVLSYGSHYAREHWFDQNTPTTETAEVAP